VRRGLKFVYESSIGGWPDPEPFRRDRAIAREAVTSLVQIVHRHRETITDAHRSMPIVAMILRIDPNDPAHIDRFFPLLLGLLVAGHETTGTLLAWALYVLSRDPALRAEIIDEIAACRATGVSATILPSQHERRPKTLAFYFELLRRYTVIAALVRHANQAGEMPPDPDTGIGGFSYPAGAMFVLSVIGLHHDPQQWPDPGRFDIRRFLEGASGPQAGRAVVARARGWEEAGKFLPFGYGPGNCIGRGFNQAEFFVVLDALLPRYEFELTDPTTAVEPTDGIVSAPPPGSLSMLIRHARGR
jgi:cytochrome P450